MKPVYDYKELMRVCDFALLASRQISLPQFMDAGKRHKSPRPEAKDFITHKAVGSMSFTVTLVPCALRVSWGLQSVAQVDAAYAAGLHHR